MILYFSGTGNSGYAARRIADGLGEPLLCLNDRIKAGDTAPVETGERLVIVTPTYAWRIPRIVEDWLLHTELTGAKRAWFVMTCGHPVIDIMPEQKSITQKGGTMRLGAYPCVLSEGSRAAALYGKTEISERHRHRYEFCNDFRDAFVAAGLIPTGLSPNERLVEIVELPEHPWFTACQFHPEFKSRPDRPHPLFLGFVEAAASRS